MHLIITNQTFVYQWRMPCQHVDKLQKFTNKLSVNKTPALAFTPPADEKKMGTICIFVSYAVYGSGRGRCRDFLFLKWEGGLNLQIWDLNQAHETERTIFPILQVFMHAEHAFLL